MNRLWFLYFNGAPLILDNYFRFLRVSGQTFSEILRISEKDWQPSLRFSNFRKIFSQRFSDFRRFLVSGFPRKAAQGANISWRFFLNVHFLEIFRISENDWQPSPQFSEKDWQLSPRFSENLLSQHQRVSKKLEIIKKISENRGFNPSWRFFESPRRFDKKRIKT